MTKKWREFKDWLFDTKYSIMFGIIIGGLIAYVYTIDQIVKDCKVLGMMRFGYKAFSCLMSGV